MPDAHRTSACASCGDELPSFWGEDVCPSCAFGVALKFSARRGKQKVVGEGEIDPAMREFGEFRLEREIGRGGMGVVYAAAQEGVGREVAVKVMLAGQLATADGVRRFHIEAESCGRLHHPNIVPVYGAGEHDGFHYLSMRLVEGAGRIAGPGGEPDKAAQREVARRMMAVVDAVAYAHGRGVLHRDLKPSNILVDAGGVPHVTDFGLAKLADEDPELTMSGALVGSPGYLSPEVARGGAEEATAASDVYGLGAVLFELLAGRAPFGGRGVAEVVRRVAEEPARWPAELRGRIDRDLATICMRCLEKEPGARYATAVEVRDELGRFLAGEPIVARPIPAGERLVRWCRRKPVLASWVGLALVALVGGVSGVTWQWQRAEQATEDMRQAIGELHFTAGTEAIERGDTRSALASLALAMRIDPGNEQARSAALDALLYEDIPYCLDAPLQHVGGAAIRDVEWRGETVMTTDASGVSVVWDVGDWERLRVVNGGAACGRAVLGREGELVAFQGVGSDQVRVMDVRRGEVVGEVPAGEPDGEIEVLPRGVRGRVPVLQWGGGSVSMRDAVSGVPLLDFKRGFGQTELASVSPDGRLVGLVDSSGAVTVVRPYTGEVVWDDEATGAAVRELVWSWDSSLVVAVSGDGKGLWWAPASPMDGEVPQRVRLEHPATLVRPDPQAQTVLAYAENPGRFDVFAAATGEPSAVHGSMYYFQSEVPRRGYEWVPRGHFEGSGGGGAFLCHDPVDADVLLGRWGDGLPGLVLDSFPEVRQMALSPDSASVAILAADGRLQLVNLQGMSTVIDLGKETEAIESVAFTPEAMRLVVTGRCRREGRTCWWVLDALSGEKLFEPIPQPVGMTDWRVAPDGLHLVAVVAEGEAAGLHRVSLVGTAARGESGLPDDVGGDLVDLLDVVAGERLEETGAREVLGLEERVRVRDAYRERAAGRGDAAGEWLAGDPLRRTVGPGDERRARSFAREVLAEAAAAGSDAPGVVRPEVRSLLAWRPDLWRTELEEAGQIAGLARSMYLLDYGWDARQWHYRRARSMAGGLAEGWPVGSGTWADDFRAREGMVALEDGLRGVDLVAYSEWVFGEGARKNPATELRYQALERLVDGGFEGYAGAGRWHLNCVVPIGQSLANVSDWCRQPEIELGEAFGTLHLLLAPHGRVNGERYPVPEGGAMMRGRLGYADGEWREFRVRNGVDLLEIPQYGEVNGGRETDGELVLWCRYEVNGTSQGVPIYAWVFENPRPGVEVECLELAPGGFGFVTVMGVTLGE